MKGDKIALTGSYAGSNTEKLLEDMPPHGILQLSLCGREITLNVKSEDLDEVKKSLRKIGVGNLSILEWRKCGMTLAGSGSGQDDAELIKVNLIPAAIDEGLRLIALLNTLPLEEELVELMHTTVEEVLDNAGISDAIFTIQVNKKATDEKYVEAVKIATLNALFESGGVVGIE
ncbi:MAG: hypothetical protein ABH834_03075 [Candidatus Altiarchaeota archaeon]